MTRPIVILLEIILLIFVLRSPFVQYFFTDMQEALSDWLIEVSQYAEQQELGELRQRLEPHTANMQDYQKQYMVDVTSNQAKLKHFYRSYCIKGDKNPYVYGATLRLICAEVARSPLIEE